MDYRAKLIEQKEELIREINREYDSNFFSEGRTNYYAIPEDDDDIDEIDLWICTEVVADFTHTICFSCSNLSIKYEDGDNYYCHPEWSEQHCHAQQIQKDECIARGILLGVKGEIVKEYFGYPSAEDMLSEIYAFKDLGQFIIPEDEAVKILKVTKKEYLLY